ncbi:hypothetical protein [uncultured Psychroserpens sp.]|uniref:hypothetical protein n=1 Tax=uncultured Psychroserpens sp. TaxID=255436 RepID=UPI00260E7D34|nr:hypothetical protein [uncultured Psychroserpens sp.]
MKEARRKKIIQFVLWMSVVVMIAHFAIIDYSNFDYKDLLGPLSNVFIILGMYVTLRDINKKTEN